jgi:hypothetical protein
MQHVKRQSRLNIRARNELIRHITNVIGGLIGTLIIAVFFSFILINWLSGCGEAFPQADGSYIQGECIYPSDLWNDRHPEHTYVEDK